MSAHLEEAQFLRFLHERGLRVTAERRALLAEIFSQHGHIDADQILRVMRTQGCKISRATVYRNLELLVECGLVHKHRLASGRYLYEHVHAGQRHHHIACARCGRLVEFVSAAIPALAAEICRAHGFAADGQQLQILSLCRDCDATRADGARRSELALA
ncbi:MAG: Fur family transcriptional regulator [Thermoanaerobaculia bacterium]